MQTVANKQGAYGKVAVHKHGLLSQCVLPEVCAILRHFCVPRARITMAHLSADHAFCEGILGHVSRSFALIIQELPPSLNVSVMVFYLVLRGLDTIEDDMDFFAGAPADKVAHLQKFHTYLALPSWRMCGVGQGKERELLEHFPCVTRLLAGLPPVHAAVIRDITASMGAGMASFAQRSLAGGTDTVAEYNLYCHYVAGLVGDGLTRLWLAEGLASASLASEAHLADDMGQMLQKTNIIRDYLEDLAEGRAFWPRDIVGLYASSLPELHASVRAGSADAPLRCLNHLVADALALAPSCLRYLESITDARIFAFCAVPQVMAMATLAALTNNERVFTGVVKIRKGEALLLMQRVEDGGMAAVRAIFHESCTTILTAIPQQHEVAARMAASACCAVDAALAAGGGGKAISKVGGGISSLRFYLCIAAVAALMLLLLLDVQYAAIWEVA